LFEYKTNGAGGQMKGEKEVIRWRFMIDPSGNFAV